MKRRLESLRTFMAEHQLDSILITKPENRRYFSGFTGTAGMLLVTPAKAFLVTDFRYVEQATAQAKYFEIVRHGSAIYDTIGQLAEQLKLRKAGFETDHISYEVYGLIDKSLGSCELVPVKLDSLRVRKDQEELRLLKKAVEIADTAFSHILTYISTGVRECDVAFELETVMRRLGSQKTAFDTIVASGKRSALPHGVASEKEIQAGDFVTMDFGAVYEGYHSDMTRTVVMGRPTEKQRSIYDTVLKAQLTGLQAVRAGRLCREIDKEARDVIMEAGYADCFGHGLGHCVGLVIHEEPRLSPNEAGRLAENMAVTVEPGIYIPDWGGVRIEDLVVVTTAGCDILTTSSKQIIEIDR